MLRDLASGLHADLRSGKAVPALAAGFTSGLGLLVAQVAFGSFIFSGPLAAYSSQGVGLVLFGNFAACLVVALGGGYRGAIAGLSPALVIVMATIGFSMDAEGQPLFVTTVVALMLSAVATGLCCLLIGRFRRANLVRFIPYPVAGGFVAGIGGAVCLAALSLMGAEPDWRALPALLEPSVLGKWSPGAVFGIALYLALKRWRHPLILPVSVALAVGAYHLALSLLGISGRSGTGGRPAAQQHRRRRPVAGAVARRPGAGRVEGTGRAGSPHDDVDSGGLHLRRSERSRPGAGRESGAGLGPGVPGDRYRQHDRGRRRRYGGHHRRAGIPAQQAVRSRHPPYRGGRRPGDRRRAVPGRRLAGAGPGVLGRGNAGLCRTRHAGRGAGKEPPAPPLVGVRHHRADLRDHHLAGTAGGRGCRDARHPGVLRRAARPRGPRSRRASPRASGTATRRARSPTAPSCWRMGSGCTVTGCAGTCSSAASARWPSTCGRSCGATRGPTACCWTSPACPASTSRR